uniref:Uncharacterized protein n=1 Tax=Macrostomum lignano TaxID=282301 RepID=A0A1I8F5R8_9PLAT
MCNRSKLTLFCLIRCRAVTTTAVVAVAPSTPSQPQQKSPSLTPEIAQHPKAQLERESFEAIFQGQVGPVFQAFFVAHVGPSCVLATVPCLKLAVGQALGPQAHLIVQLQTVRSIAQNSLQEFSTRFLVLHCATGTPASELGVLIDSRNRRWAARLLATTSRSLTPCRSSFSKAMKAAAAAPQAPDPIVQTLNEHSPPNAFRTLCRSTRLNGFPSNRPRRRSEALCGWLLGNLKETRNTRSSAIRPRWTWSVESAALDDATVAVASLTTLTAQLDVPAADGRSSMIDARTTGLAASCWVTGEASDMQSSARAERCRQNIRAASRADASLGQNRAELGDGGATTGGNGDFESEAALKDYLDRLQVYYAMVSRPSAVSRCSALCPECRVFLQCQCVLQCVFLQYRGVPCPCM